MEMLAFALVTTTRRLQPYFQNHLITKTPLQKVLQNLGALKRWVKIPLSPVDYHFTTDMCYHFLNNYTIIILFFSLLLSNKI